MSRRDDQRLADILAATDAIASHVSHVSRGSLSDGLIFDAVRVRLIEIGEAVKAIDPDLLGKEPGIPWIDVAGMRNQLAHRYFDTAHGIVAATVTEDLPPLISAVKRLLKRILVAGEPLLADQSHRHLTLQLLGGSPSSVPFECRPDIGLGPQEPGRFWQAYSQTLLASVYTST